MLMFSSRMSFPIIFWIFILAGILSIEFAVAPETGAAKKPAKAKKKSVGFGGAQTQEYEVDGKLKRTDSAALNNTEDAGEKAAWKKGYNAQEDEQH
ncbi:hypothetical protein Ddc_12031 [Ditylenchus destructor]|nr:hypothetical protein Ddc_12031 [Ditylenchus destructor]